MTEKQKRFIDYYMMTGNASESSRLAGYKGNNLDVIGAKNFEKLKSHIIPRIEELDLSRTAELQEILIFWSDIIRDNTLKTSDRLRASELLAKSQGAFIEKVEVNQVDTDWFI